MKDYHEPWERLPSSVRDRTRALTSLREEIEAVDWYDQRVQLCEDEELKAILAHNRDEEIEHACMTLEWLRRNSAAWDEQLRTYLFSKGSILEAEHAAGASGKAGTEIESSSASKAPTSLGLGSLKKDRGE